MPIYYRRKDEFQIVPKENVEVMIKFAKSFRDSCLLVIVWLTGARIGEVLQLKTSDIDFDVEKNECRIRLKTFKVKNHPLRELVFSLKTPFIKSYVENYHRNCLTERMFPFCVRRAEQILQEINKETKFWVTFHELRHSRLTFIGRNLRASVSEMMDWTGWTTPSELGTYIIKGTPERFKDKIQ